MPAMSVVEPGALGMYSRTEVGEGSNWRARLEDWGGGKRKVSGGGGWIDDRTFLG
jgi:hypothetical protein